MLFCSNALLQLMGFFYRVALSRLADASALGLNSLVMQIYGIVVSICISGVNVAVSATAARTDRGEIAGLFRSALVIYTVLFSAAAAPILLFSKQIAERALGCAGTEGTLMLMLLCIFLTGIENVLKSLHIGTKHVKQCALSELIEQAVRFALVILMLIKLEHADDAKTVFLIMLGMTASEFVSVGFLTISFRRVFGRIDPVGKAPLIRPLAATAFPALLTAASSTVFASVGSLLLPAALIRFGMTREAALSGIGEINTAIVPLTMLPMAFIGALSAVVMPEVSSLTAAGKSPVRLIRGSLRCAAAIGAASAAIMLLFGGRIASFFFGFRPEAQLLAMLELKALVIYLQVTSVAVLNGLMRQRTVLLFAACSEAYQLALILLLTPVFGFIGYAFSLLTGELLRLLLGLGAIKDICKNGMEINLGIC